MTTTLQDRVSQNNTRTARPGPQCARPRLRPKLAIPRPRPTFWSQTSLVLRPTVSDHITDHLAAVPVFVARTSTDLHGRKHDTQQHWRVTTVSIAQQWCHVVCESVILSQTNRLNVLRGKQRYQWLWQASLPCLWGTGRPSEWWVDQSAVTAWEHVAAPVCYG